MYEVKVFADYCKGCSLCVAACPKDIMELTDALNAYGVHYARCVDNELCIGCMSCAVICPDAAIEIIKLEPHAATK